MTTATKVPRHPEAFSLSTDPARRPRKEGGAHLVFIRTLPCLVSGFATNIEAAHIRFASLAHGKPESGLQRKPSDVWVVPLSPVLHRKQHAMSEKEFWAEQDIDPLVVAALLYANTGDREACLQILRAARTKRFAWVPW